MVIEVACPECGETYRFSPDKAGKKFRCRSCKDILAIQPLPSGRKSKTDTKKATQGSGKQPRKKKRKAHPTATDEHSMPMWQVGLACLGIVAVFVVGFSMMPGPDDPNLITSLITGQPDARVSHAGFVESVEVTPHGLKISPALPQEPVTWQGTFVELIKLGKYTTANITLADPIVSLPVVVRFWVEDHRVYEWLTVPKGTKVRFQGTFDDQFTIVSAVQNANPVGHPHFVYNEMESRDIKRESVSDSFKSKYPGSVTQYWFSLNDVSLVDYTPPESMSPDSSIASFLESQRVVTELNDDGQLTGVTCGKLLDLSQVPTIAQLKHLTSFRMISSDFNDEHLKQLTACKTIEELWLSGCQVTPHGLQELSQFPNLRFLILTDSTRISDSIIPLLESLKTVKVFNLSETALTSSGIEQLEKARPYVSVISDKTGNPGWQQSILLEEGATLTRLLFSPDSSAIYTANSKDNHVVVERHSLAEPADVIKRQYPGRIQELYQGDRPDQVLVAYLSSKADDASIMVDHFPGGEDAYSLPGTLMKLSPDKTTILVTRRGESVITVHDSATGEQLTEISETENNRAAIHDVYFTSDSSGLVRRTSRNITLFDLSDRKTPAQSDFVSLHDSFTRTHPIPVAPQYWALFGDNALFIFDHRTNSRETPQRTEISATNGLYVPQSGTLLVYELNGPIRVIDPLELSVIATIPNDAQLSWVTLSNDGHILKASVASAHRPLTVWNIESREKVVEIPDVYSSAFSADSKLLATFDKKNHKLEITSLLPD
ncbi:hypothetical protein [Rubinisphaera margarita]|uniref:hypothetical protein n=1 Tax=Rubinisphaera margarita TaxID=2909586 RepID=UPI001EE7C2B1|nr:hypothetical protein [Rubinisphaera margarita]MCG6154642.1 hypothetical protein [Rubinisphaera margarita]